MARVTVEDCLEKVRQSLSCWFILVPSVLFNSARVPQPLGGSTQEQRSGSCAQGNRSWRGYL